MLDNGALAGSSCDLGQPMIRGFERSDVFAKVIDGFFNIRFNFSVVFTVIVELDIFGRLSSEFHSVREISKAHSSIRLKAQSRSDGVIKIWLKVFKANYACSACLNFLHARFGVTIAPCVLGLQILRMDTLINIRFN